MIVGRKDIDFTKLKLACRSEDSLLRFTIDLVPTPLRHIREVVDNQKYLVALHVRSLQSLPWQKRKDLCEHLLHGARIKGVYLCGDNNSTRRSDATRFSLPYIMRQYELSGSQNRNKTDMQ